MNVITCPFCKSDRVKHIRDDEYASRDGYSFDCNVCGKFFITRSADMQLRDKEVDPRYFSWIRAHVENDKKPPVITSYTIDELPETFPKLSVPEKQVTFLRAIERRSKFPGAEVVLIADHDYPLAYAENCEELKFLCRSLAERQLITINDDRFRANIIQAIITAKGWEFLETQANIPTLSTQAFVAMSFDSSMNDAWEIGIKPAIETAGYKAHRIDQEHHIDRIDAKIISDLKDSLFVVADVTQQKPGVYFEAGYAIGLNRPVIWCVRKDDLKNIHFDTRQYNHIVWETPEELKEQLYYRICAVIGKRG